MQDFQTKQREMATHLFNSHTHIGYEFKTNNENPFRWQDVISFMNWSELGEIKSSWRYRNCVCSRRLYIASSVILGFSFQDFSVIPWVIYYDDMKLVWVFNAVKSKSIPILPNFYIMKNLKITWRLSISLDHNRRVFWYNIFWDGRIKLSLKR